jgi:ribonucleoside-diphosphate reductase alpha chain
MPKNSKIDQKITGYRVKQTLEPVITQTPMGREEVLQGKTYKITPGGDYAYYITINDVTSNGICRPYEIFVNTKDINHYQWVTLFSRLASAIMRNGGDYAFIAEEMKAIEDPKTGRFVPKKGFVPSLVAEIGLVVEEHFKNLKN